MAPELNEEITRGNEAKRSSTILQGAFYKRKGAQGFLTARALAALAQERRALTDYLSLVPKCLDEPETHP